MIRFGIELKISLNFDIYIYYIINLILLWEYDIKIKSKEDENGSRDVRKFWKRSLKFWVWELGVMVFF